MNSLTGDITLELETIKLVLDPALGCSIASLMVRNHQHQWAPVLRSMPGDSASASDAGSFVMLPWTNRIKDARFDFNNQTHALNPNNADGSAIHGVARALPWTIADRSPITARFVLDSRSFDAGTINYPFHFGAVQRFEIAPDRVEIDLSITNLDSVPIPVGCGHHPYISRGLFSDADELRVQLDVSGRYPTAGCIPVGEPIDDEVCAALRSNEPIPQSGLDDVFSGFAGVAKLTWAASNIAMTMRCADEFNHLVIYTPTTSKGSSTGFICIEPTTMVNDGFNQLAQGKPSTGVVVLEPNQTLRTHINYAFSGLG